MCFTMKICLILMMSISVYFEMSKYSSTKFNAKSSKMTMNMSNIKSTIWTLIFSKLSRFFRDLCFRLSMMTLSFKIRFSKNFDDNSNIKKNVFEKFDDLMMLSKQIKVLLKILIAIVINSRLLKQSKNKKKLQQAVCFLKQSKISRRDAHLQNNKF